MRPERRIPLTQSPNNNCGLENVFREDAAPHYLETFGPGVLSRLNGSQEDLFHDIPDEEDSDMPEFYSIPSSNLMVPANSEFADSSSSEDKLSLRSSEFGSCSSLSQYIDAMDRCHFFDGLGRNDETRLEQEELEKAFNQCKQNIQLCYARTLINVISTETAHAERLQMAAALTTQTSSKKTDSFASQYKTRPEKRHGASIFLNHYTNWRGPQRTVHTRTRYDGSWIWVSLYTASLILMSVWVLKGVISFDDQLKYEKSLYQLDSCR